VFSIIFEGLILGLILAITPGPVFFTILQTGINRGFWPGLKIALGVLLSDITLILISYWGISEIMGVLENKTLIALVGGMVLIVFGTVTTIRKPDALRRRDPKIKYTVPSTVEFVVKGFFLNLSNPALIFFWLTAMSWVTAQAGELPLKQTVLLFFSTTVAVVLITDLIKCYIGVQIKKYLKLRVQMWINRVVGVFLIVVGAILILQTFFALLIE